MVPLSFPSPEGRGDQRGEDSQCTTVTVPVMLGGWLVHE
jgi:hypothetical protein